PVIFIENLPIYGTPMTPHERGQRMPLGKARIAAEGKDITIVAYSGMVNRCLAALEEIYKAGIGAEIVDLRTVSPWDQQTVAASVEKTGLCLIVHEAVQQFGVGAEIAAVVGERFFGRLRAPVKRIGAPFVPVPFAKPLETAFVPDPKRIAAAAIQLVRGQ